MSTRSHIGIRNEDGSLDVIYCHHDGYLSYNGNILFHHYQDPEKVRELVSLGDISSLDINVKPTDSAHSFETPQKNVVVAYGRDRHEDGVDTRHFESMDAYMSTLKDECLFIEYVYLYNVMERKWEWMDTYKGVVKEYLKELTEEVLKDAA